MALLFELKQKLSAFAHAWNRWPRKEAKKDAEKAWNQVNPDGALDHTIDRAMDVWVPIFEEREVRYRPLLASWLRGHRWEDEPPTPTKKTTTSRPTAKVVPLMAQQQMDAASRIRSLVALGVSPEDAKQQVYRDMGWVKE